MNKFLKYFLIIGSLLLLIGTFAYLINKSIDKPVEYAIERPKLRTIVKKTVANGSVIPRQEIAIKPTVSGIIRELMVEAGDQVKKGDVLARIQIVPDMLSLSNAENRVRTAEINLQNAQLNIDRNKPLKDKGVISAAEYQTFDVAFKNAQAELTAAQDNLGVVRDGISRSSASTSNTLVRSTIDGMVLDVPVKEGNSVIERNNFNEGTTIASVADMSDLIFEGNLDESEVGKVRLGMPIVLTIGAIDSARWEAELEYIAPKGVEEQGAIQFKIRAAVKLKEGQDLRAGYSANADIVLDKIEDVLSIPEGVISFTPKGDSAFVEVKGEAPGEWVRTYIRTGLSDGIDIAVLSGITLDSELKGAAIVEEKKKGPPSM